MSETFYKGYTKLNDIFERYAIYNYDEKMVNFLIGECANFLHSKNLDSNILNHFTIEFEISQDQSYIGFRGGNLMSTLWLINVYPPDPEKFITENVCIFDEKKYIYNPSRKSLKITKYATKRSRHQANY